MPELKGSCLCGAVRYEGQGEPVFSGVCHCRDCQKSGGGGYSVVIGVPAAGLRIEGELSTYEAPGGSGQTVRRRFCSRCGSPVLTEAAAFPGVALLKAPSLDDPSWVEPQAHIWCASAQPWDTIPESAMRFPQSPPLA